MAKYLNGWRRMAIVFVGTWLIVAAAILTTELMREKPIFFTYRMLPAGVVFEKGKVTFPDGKVYIIDTMHPETGQTTVPWEIDWTKYPEIPQYSLVDRSKYILLGLLAPLLLWALLELVSLTVKWIQAGFNRSGACS